MFPKETQMGFPSIPGSFLLGHSLEIHDLALFRERLEGL